MSDEQPTPLLVELEETIVRLFLEGVSLEEIAGVLHGVMGSEFSMAELREVCEAIMRQRLTGLTAYKASHKRPGRKRIWTDLQARNVEMCRRYRERKKQRRQAETPPTV